MKEFNVIYVPIGVPTFELVSAQKEFEKSVDALKGICEDIKVPDKMLLSLDDLKKYLEESKEPDLIILQNITFANAAYTAEVIKRFNSPIILWTLREPVIDGGRLRLNSLTGAYSAANTIREVGRNSLEYVFGSPEETEVLRKLSAAVCAAKTRYKMSNLKLAMIGHTPQGFGFGRALDSDMLKTFGVTLEAIEARELIEKAKKLTDDDCEDYISDADKRIVGLKTIEERNVLDFSRLYKAYKDYVDSNGIKAIATRCWPDFFTDFGTPVCAVLAMLNDLGVAASCEADAYGALSMYVSMEMTGKPAFFGDPVSLDEGENTITFWHCGMAACSLAREDRGAEVGLHPNRKIGPVLDFGCKESKHVTVFRIGRKPEGGFRFFILKGEALDKPKQFNGTSIVVKSEGDAKTIVTRSVKEGWEPHFAVAYGDISEELRILAEMLNIEVCSYN